MKEFILNNIDNIGFVFGAVFAFFMISTVSEYSNTKAEVIYKYFFVFVIVYGSAKLFQEFLTYWFK